MTGPIPTIKALSLPHLTKLVHTALQDEGPYVDLNFIDVSSIADMSQVFSGLDFRGDISRWDVSNVANAMEMFQNCPFNGDISNWDVSRLAYAPGMFMNSKFSGDLSKWKTSNLQVAEQMFRWSRFEGNISTWDVSNVISFSRMFEGAPFCGDLSQWRISPEADISNMVEPARLAQMREPNALHWLQLICQREDDSRYPPLWKEHAAKNKDFLLGMGLQALEAARMLQTLWQTQTAAIVALALPELGDR